LIIPLVQGRDLGWPVWTYLSMTGSIIALALFVISERRSRHPVITPLCSANAASSWDWPSWARSSPR